MHIIEILDSGYGITINLLLIIFMLIFPIIVRFIGSYIIYYLITHSKDNN